MSQLRLGSAQVSKRRAALQQRHGQIYLRDLASTNGTFVNGQQIRDLEVELQDGDKFQIGPVRATLAIGVPQENPVLEENLVPDLVEMENEAPTLLAPLSAPLHRRAADY